MKTSTLNTFIFALLFFVTGVLNSFGQKLTKIDSIVEEGITLYKAELAAWNGSDLWMTKSKKQKEGVGYITYSEGATTKCVFFGSGDLPKALTTYSFDSTFNVASAIIDTVSRKMTKMELSITALQKATVKALQTDTVFKFYQKANPNIIPISDKAGNRVYVITGPSVTGVVLLGNDYLLNFDQEQKLMGVEKLHKNLIPIQYNGEEMTTMHSHLPETGEFITPTDICTVMLYGKTANWNQHIVISGTQVSIWDVKKGSLATLTKEAWEKINGKK